MIEILHLSIQKIYTALAHIHKSFLDKNNYFEDAKSSIFFSLFLLFGVLRWGCVTRYLGVNGRLPMLQVSTGVLRPEALPSQPVSAGVSRCQRVSAGVSGGQRGSASVSGCQRASASVGCQRARAAAPSGAGPSSTANSHRTSHNEGHRGSLVRLFCTGYPLNRENR